MTDLGTPASVVASEVAMAAVREVWLGDSGTVVTVTGTVVTVTGTVVIVTGTVVTVTDTDSRVSHWVCCGSVRQSHHSRGSEPVQASAVRSMDLGRAGITKPLPH